MATERNEIGLQPFKRGAVTTPGAHASGEVIPADRISPLTRLREGAG